jgi:hypothetical protein
MTPPPPRNLWPRSSRWMLLLLVLAVTGGILYREFRTPRTEKERVRAAFDDFIEAVRDEDYDEVWDLESVEFKDFLSRELERTKGLPASDPVWEDSVVSRDELLDMDVEEFFSAAAGIDEETRALILACEPETIELLGSSAVIHCTAGDQHPQFHFELEDDEWRISLFMSNRMEFKTLACKLAVFLPRTALAPEDIDLLVTVGPEGADEESLERLDRLLAAVVAEREDRRARAVLDADPRLSMQAVIRVFDVLLSHQVTDVCFTEYAAPDSAASPPSGLQVNGRPIGELDSLADPVELPPVAGHPALSRLLELR